MIEWPSVRRGLLDIITVASLLMFLAAAGLWVRGYAAMDLVRVHRMNWDVKHNTIPQSETYLTSSRGWLGWANDQGSPLIEKYLQRDFELHWQSEPLQAANFPRDAIWIGWVVMGTVALPAGRVGLWTWRRKRWPKQGVGEIHRRMRGAYVLRVLACVVWAAMGAAVVVAVFWARSYPYFERVDWKLWCSQAAGVQVNSSMGSLMLAWTNKGPDRMIKRGDFAFIRTCEPPTRGPLYEAADLVGPYVEVAGFTLGTDGSTPLASNVLTVPYWFVEAVLLGAASLAWRYVRRQSKRAEGQLCARCGYDLRATPERCPECGLKAMDLPALGNQGTF